MSRTLLLDDDPFALRLLSHQLMSVGWPDPECYLDPRQAVARVTTDPHSLDCIFCDLQMPAMDGVECIRQFSSAGYANNLVLMSGESGRILQAASRLARAQGLNIIGVLSKPTCLKQLEQLLMARDCRLSNATRAAPALRPLDEIDAAIRTGELVNAYQPKISLSTGEIVGLEALVRWEHPVHGLLPPATFVPVAESNGLMGQLTDAVLRGAARQVKAWQTEGLDLPVSVNISMDNLTTLAFPDNVTEILRDAGISASSITLEVTETQLMRDPLTALDILTRLRLKHIGLSIDDFGTGHSSLSQLRDLPFTELKIDRSFVHGAHREPDLRAIVDGSLQMARDLGLSAVAEGVEDEADWRFLADNECDVAQGYFMGKPMSGADLGAWMADWFQRYQALNLPEA